MEKALKVFVFLLSFVQNCHLHAFWQKILPLLPLSLCPSFSFFTTRIGDIVKNLKLKGSNVCHYAAMKRQKRTGPQIFLTHPNQFVCKCILESFQCFYSLQILLVFPIWPVGEPKHSSTNWHSDFLKISRCRELTSFSCLLTAHFYV